MLAAALLTATMGLAWAQADVNKADQAALESVQGVGPAMSKKILDARAKGGNFKDWNDLEARVAGIKDKSATRLSKAGLTVDGKSRPDAPAPARAAVPQPKPVKATGREAGSQAKQ